MASILSTGQITIVDLNDSISIQNYLTTTGSKNQYLSSDNVYSPSWATTPVVIDAQLYVTGGGGSNLVAINDSRIKSITWAYKLGSGNYTTLAAGVTGNYNVSTPSGYRANSRLTINGNVMTKANPTLDIRATIVFTDNRTNEDFTVVSDMPFSLAVQGDTGKDAYTVLLDNAVQSFSASETGSIASTQTVTVNIIAYKGTTAITPTNLVLPANPAGAVLTKVDNDTFTFAASTGTALAANGTITVTATVDGQAFPLVFSWSKLNQGLTGRRTAVANMYIWSATTPTTFPTGTSTYTWATNSHTAASTPNSWSLTPGTGSPGQTLWRTSVGYSDNSNTATSTITWPSSGQVAQASGVYGETGGTGAPGQSTAVVTLYKWATSTPTTFPTGNGSYNWNTNTITLPATANGWTVNPGTGSEGQTLYSISTTISAPVGTTSSNYSYSASPTVSTVSAIGSSPTTYSGSVSPNAILIKKDGTFLENTITMKMFSQKGTDPIAPYGGTFDTYTTTNGTTWTAVNETAGATGVATYVVPNTTIKAVRVDFKVGSVIIDSQTVPVISDGVDSVNLEILTPSGNVISKPLQGAGDPVVLIPEMREGGQVVSPTGGNWKRQIDGGWSAALVNTASAGTDFYTLSGNTLTVYPDLVDSYEVFKFEGTYKGTVYTAMIAVIDQTDPYSVEIYSTTGDKILNGVGSTIIRADLIQDGVVVNPDPAVNQGLVYTWTKYNADGSVDATFNQTPYIAINPTTSLPYVTAKVLQIPASEIDGKASFFCTISKP